MMNKSRSRPVALALMCFITAAMAAAAADSAAYAIPEETPAFVRKAVQAPDRSAEQTARDANRKPAELLTLSGVKPGDRVVEFASFGQYFTALLSDVVESKGMIYMLDLPYTEKRFGEAGRAFAAAHANVKYELVDYNTVELPRDVDVVFNVLYYHDLKINDIDTARLNARIFKALRPGGIFLVVDHNAAPGSGVRDTRELHRIDPKIIRDEVKAAGFELVTESTLLAREADDHTQRVFAPGLRGLTDQSIFKFRKPTR